MTKYSINWKQGYRSGTYEYAGDIRGLVDIIRGMLAIEDVCVEGIQSEEWGESQ